MKDAFISHASEDKKELAEPIYHALTNYGKTVWLDKYEIIPGRSLMQQIDDGLSTSKYGILLITPSFIKKPWPKAELQALFGSMMAGEKEVIPVWHGVTQKDVRSFSPLLADLVAVTTANKTIYDIVLEILRVVSPKMAEGLLRAKIVTDNMDSGEYKRLKIDDLTKVKSGGPVIHEELPKRVISDAALICEVLGEFQSMNLEQFLDNLSRDHHYDDELTVWHKIAAIFYWAVTTHELNEEDERKEAFILIDLLSMVKELPPESIKLRYLKPKVAEAIRTAWDRWPSHS
jgi:hypothetical protein